MAFKIKNKQYVRLFNDCDINFEIYRSESDRLKVKNATPSAIILNKYQELIREKEHVLATYVRDNKIPPKQVFKRSQEDEILKTYFADLYALRDEYAQYQFDLSLEKGAQHNFPLMEVFYIDIKDSIPNIIEKGFTLLDDAESVDDLYIAAKKLKRFGKTTDC